MTDIPSESLHAEGSRYFMQLSYMGAHFLGWQIQPQGFTVQGVLQSAMSTLLRRQISVTGAGRTDTGVNARRMIAHFDYEGPLPDKFMRSLNSMVGRDIAVERIWRVDAGVHARFDATERTYRYYVTTDKTPFIHNLTWQAPAMLDFEAMNRGAEYLLGRQDFTSFSKLHTQVKTNICDVRRARWERQRRGVWYFEISADRFLRNMVRAIVGTLVDVGRNKIAPEAVAEIIAQHDRGRAGVSMPAHALYLWDIRYDKGVSDADTTAAGDDTAFFGEIFFEEIFP